MTNQAHVVIRHCAHPGSSHSLPRYLSKAADAHAMRKSGLSASRLGMRNNRSELLTNAVFREGSCISDGDAHLRAS